MKRSLLIALGVLLAPALLHAQAPAPYVRPNTNPYGQPVFSPYLNLLNRGTNPAVNYFGLVRPQIEFRGNLRQLQQDINTVSAGAAAEENLPLPATGHQVRFGNLSHYYGGLSSRGTTGLAGSAGQPTVTPRLPTGATQPGTRPQRAR